MFDSFWLKLALIWLIRARVCATKTINLFTQVFFSLFSNEKYHSLGKHIGTEVAQSGLGNDNQEKTYHSYYQWVPFVLFFQVCQLQIKHLNYTHFDEYLQWNKFAFLCRVVCFMCRITFGRTSKMAKLVWSHRVFVVCLRCHQKSVPADKSVSSTTFWKVCAPTMATRSVTFRVKFWIWSMSSQTSYSLM